MQTFLSTCQKLGLDQISQRGQKLRASIPSGLQDSLLFLICGYDFIHYPSDRKFSGIEAVFVRSNGAIPLNLYPNCIDEFTRTLTAPTINASVEGTSWMGGAGKRVNFSPALMAKPVGVRDGGAGNYNLQTKALEVIVTHGEGLNKDSALEAQIVPTLQRVFALPPGPRPGMSEAGARHANTVEAQFMADMRQAVSPYWGADTMRLGV